MNLMKQLFKGEKGSVTVLVAAAMVVFSAFTALVADAGLLYINRAKLVDALDSAVLAGAQKLPYDRNEAMALAKEYAQKNQLKLEECVFEISCDGTTITGRANREVNLFFARVIGHNIAEVSAVAKARVKPISGVRGVTPFGVLEDDYEFGEIVVLKEGAGDGLYSGWFGALRLGKSGASQYENNVKYGYQNEVKVGDIIPIESGNMSGPTKKGIEYRINSCKHSPHCSIYSFVEGCPRILIVPIINIEEVNDGGHPSSVKVVAFGAFLVDAYVGNGNENMVQGAFIRYVVPGATDGSSKDFGLYGSELFD